MLSYITSALKMRKGLKHSCCLFTFLILPWGSEAESTKTWREGTGKMDTRPLKSFFCLFAAC